MKELINQAGAIIRLGGAAIDFARMDVDVLESEVLGGRSTLDQIRLVIAAYQPRDEGIIRISIGDEARLSTFKVFIVPSIFIHGVSKLLDNAVKAAKAPLTSGGKDARVEVSALLDQSGLTVKIKNTGFPVSEEVFGEVRRALLNGDVDVFTGDQLRPSLGLHEAWRCFRKLGVKVAVARPDPPFAVEVALLLRPYR
jgi:signal transduction histidine kinase